MDLMYFFCISFICLSSYFHESYFFVSSFFNESDTLFNLSLADLMHLLHVILHLQHNSWMQYFLYKSRCKTTQIKTQNIKKWKHIQRKGTAKNNNDNFEIQNLKQNCKKKGWIQEAKTKLQVKKKKEKIQKVKLKDAGEKEKQANKRNNTNLLDPLSGVICVAECLCIFQELLFQLLINL